MRKKNSQRNQHGTIYALFFCALIIAVLSTGALATDFCHMLSVQNELQNAADAGALAGAQDLWSNVSQCQPDALAVTGQNLADGKAVSPSTNGCTVNVSVVPPKPPSMNGTVQVTATIKIRDILGEMFGRSFETLSATAVAGTYGRIQTVYSGGVFPLAVSWDTKPGMANGNGTGQPLSSYKIGDSVSFNLNNQGVKNAAWTSLTVSPASASWVDSAIKMALGTEPLVPGFIPAVSVGDNINLSNGVSSGNFLMDQQASAFLSPTLAPLVLPVFSGDPAMNKSRQCIGFITFKPTNITRGNGGGIVETITGTLMQTQIKGMSGPINSASNSTLYNMQPGPIQLIR